MLRKSIKPIVITLTIGIMVFCYGMALVESDSVKRGQEVQILYKDGEPLTGREAIQLLERESEQEDPLHVTLWGRIPGQILRCDEFNRQVEVEMIVVTGESSLLFSTRTSLGREDVNGILLSRDVAHRLLGKTSAVDIKIIYEDREYIFRGIIEGAENTAVIQGSSQTPRVLDAAVIRIPEGRGQAGVIREFEMRFWQVDGVFDLGLLGALGNLFVLFLPMVIAGYLVLKGIKQVFLYRRTPVKAVVWMGCCVVMGLGFILLHQGIPRVNLDFSPTMWSDFGYWQHFFSRKGDTLTRMLQGEWREPERIALSHTWLMMQYGFVAAGIFLCFIRKLKVENCWWILLYSSGSLVAVFLVIVESGRNDFPGVWSLWGLVSFYLVAKKLLEVGAMIEEEEPRIEIVFDEQ